MEAGLDGPDGDAEGGCRFRQRQVEEEAQDDDSALLGLEPREGAVEDVPISDERRRVGDGRVIDGSQLHLDDAGGADAGPGRGRRSR